MSSLPRKPSAIADPRLGPIGADRELALLHIPTRLRDAFAALFAVDSAMADVVARTTDPALGRIKLAWWREQLQALDSDPPPAEPRLAAVAEHLLPLGIGGKDLAELEAGWATLLDPEVDSALVAERGAELFGIAGRLLGSADEKLGDAGALYALASVGRRGVPELFGPARDRLERLRRHRFLKGVRPVTMLARAAARDLQCQEREGSRGRALAMLAHRWSGIVSR
jgi:15-cis-phytoene synthase